MELIFLNLKHLNMLKPPQQLSCGGGVLVGGKSLGNELDGRFASEAV